MAIALSIGNPRRLKARYRRACRTVSAIARKSPIVASVVGAAICVSVSGVLLYSQVAQTDVTPVVLLPSKAYEAPTAAAAPEPLPPKEPASKMEKVRELFGNPRRLGDVFTENWRTAKAKRESVAAALPKDPLAVPQVAAAPVTVTPVMVAPPKKGKNGFVIPPPPPTGVLVPPPPASMPIPSVLLSPPYPGGVSPSGSGSLLGAASPYGAAIAASSGINYTSAPGGVFPFNAPAPSWNPPIPDPPYMATGAGPAQGDSYQVRMLRHRKRTIVNR